MSDTPTDTATTEAEVSTPPSVNPDAPINSVAPHKERETVTPESFTISGPSRRV